MGLDSLLDKLIERQRVFAAGLGTFQDETERGMHALSRSLEEAQRHLDEREPLRLQRARESIDVTSLMSRVKSRDFASLSRRERRAVPSLWREVGLEGMRWFLKESPESALRLVRQRLRDWSLAEDERMQLEWARLAAGSLSAARTSRWVLPLPVESVLGRRGPELLATRWAEDSLLQVVEKLRAAGMRAGMAYVGHVVAAHLRQGREAQQEGTVSLAFLLDDARGRPWLPLSSSAGDTLQAPLEARVEVVAAALEYRAQGACSEEVRARLSDRLVSGDSDFGDPRLTTLTQAWAKVQEHSPDAFRAFLSGLIQQDLQFFFERAMDEEDRRDFWLRYLGSIRSTTCWLEPDAYDELRRRLDALPPEQQAAFKRAKKFARERVSAFCLYFEHYVVVEFSTVGHASFVYGHADFERKLKGHRVVCARDLSDGLDGRFHTRRLVHGQNWERRFAQTLLELRIEADRRGRSPRR
ncbi:EH signature domain-containing protein [Pyxidicoccus sp. MSG2]|uniref:EH signature domain-containing protein n=1 Tax=Pyxidicoccus sp. MSG2 TaxID=2996790 RepID=UPI002271A3A1|nr:EH signature domain-containing protein [Pyxidicoccus sp. MSG2]MCY1019357.1 EH signature domain-containing protein [Pyxidicoccus sp. MSG2]